MAALDQDPAESLEWMESLDYTHSVYGPGRVEYLLGKLMQRARFLGGYEASCLPSPYLNSIPSSEEPPYPGDAALEERIENLIRWNALAMVIRANREDPSLHGHVATYASAATLYEVGFNHFFRGTEAGGSGDQVFFQGHASPGIYARAYLEGRLSEGQLRNFRRELRPPGGLSSYPHPWLMPGFWQFPTVSMGLGPLMGVYQARFNRYLSARGIRDTSDSRVWVFLGDGETDEPEALGAIGLASREGLDNLTFVVNCNLQRLDGPVRGNGKIIQELEARFHGAGWNAIKVLWGREWDALLRRDVDGALVSRLNETLDGEFQKYTVMPGAYMRDRFFGVSPHLERLVAGMSGEEIARLRRGGARPDKSVCCVPCCG